jgi:hypothetical protein
VRPKYRWCSASAANERASAPRRLAASRRSVAVDVPRGPTSVQISQRIPLANDSIGIEDPQSLLQISGSHALPTMLGADVGEPSVKRLIISRKDEKLDGRRNLHAYLLLAPDV